MYKAKLCGFAIACMVGLVGISPTTTFAAETNTESATLSEVNHKEKDAAFEEKVKKASEKWETLTEKQKEKVYSLLEDKVKSEMKLIGQLVEYGVIEEEDATNMKAHMMENFSKVKQSGKFPLQRNKSKKSSK